MNLRERLVHLIKAAIPDRCGLVILGVNARKSDTVHKQVQMVSSAHNTLMDESSTRLPIPVLWDGTFQSLGNQCVSLLAHGPGLFEMGYISLSTGLIA